jgi:putative ABC transport system permease protein
VAAANVANLLLVRLEGRRRELAVRAALGAGWGALTRHLMAEGAVLSLAAGVLGVLLAWAGTAFLLTLAPETLPRIDNVAFGAGEILFGLALSVGITLSITALLALRRTPILITLGGEGRGATGGRERTRFRSGLVMAQMAFALVLVVGAGLLIESFAKLRAIDLGFDPGETLAVTVYLPDAEYGTMDAVWRFHDQFHERVAALPGVRAVGAGSGLPVESGYGCTAHGFEEAEVRSRLEASGQTNCAGLVVTVPGYFEALGIPLVAGRTLTAADSENPDRGAVVVSRAFAERFWPGEDPVGKGISPGGLHEPFYRVVGVVGDVPAGAADGPPAVAAYYPVIPIPERWGWQMPTLSLLVRLDGADPGSMVPVIGSLARELDPAALVGNDRTMRSIVAASLSTVSFTMVLLGVAGTLSLVLAAVGLYGVVSHVVTTRRREMGVRVALGARPGQVQGQVVGRAMTLVAAGLLLGVVGALAGTRLLQGFLYEVEPNQPTSFLAAGLLLAAVALVASWLPARRAARVDPIIALRAE